MSFSVFIIQGSLSKEIQRQKKFSYLSCHRDKSIFCEKDMLAIFALYFLIQFCYQKNNHL